MSKKDQMVNFLHKNLKQLSVLKTLKELKEVVNKVTKLMHEQNGNFNRENNKLKNSGV